MSQRNAAAGTSALSFDGRKHETVDLIAPDPASDAPDDVDRFQSAGKMRYADVVRPMNPPMSTRGDVMAPSDNKMGDTDEKIFIGKGDEPAWLTLALGNRHGLVTGATGTGKTVSLQVIAEGFARAGVPVFA